MRVVDASVVLGWLLRDPVPRSYQAVLADHVSGRTPAVAPELLMYEVANVLACGAGLPGEGARQGLANLAALEIDTLSLGAREYELSLELALDHRITVYDASYIVLAKALGARFVTADRKLAKRISRLGITDLLNGV